MNMRSFVNQAVIETGRFFQWWLQEIKEARSALFERFGKRRMLTFTLDLSDEQPMLVAARGAWPIVLTQDGLPSLASVFPEDAPAAAQADVILPASAVLMFQLRLPPLADRDIPAAVSLQLEKELPLPAAQLSVDWRVLETAADRSRSIEVAAARLARVTHWRDQVRGWGWGVTRIGARGSAGEARFDLTPRTVPKLNLTVGRRELLLLAVAAGLCGVYVSVILGQWIYERAALSERVAQAREQVTQVEQLKAQLKRERVPLESVRALMTAPSAGEALIALSKALPRDSWLYQVDVRTLAEPLTIAAEGYTPAASALTSNLERHLARVELLEVSSVELGERRDRIKLRAGLRPAGQP